MWLKDIYAGCESCGNTIWMDGKTIAEAKEQAKSLGWRLRPLTCPTCLETERKTKHGGVTASSQAFDFSTEPNANSNRTNYTVAQRIWG